EGAERRGARADEAAHVAGALAREPAGHAVGAGDGARDRARPGGDRAELRGGVALERREVVERRVELRPATRQPEPGLDRRSLQRATGAAIEEAHDLQQVHPRARLA